MVRIVHAADYGAAVPGSFVAGLRAVFALVQRRGWKAELVLPERARGRDWTRAMTEEGVTVTFSTSRQIGSLTELGPTSSGRRILHTHFTRFDTTAAAIGLLGGEDVVWHLHTPPVRRWSNTRDAAQFGVLASRTTRVLCVGEHLRVDAVRHGAPAERVHVVRNGIDLERFRPPQGEERATARRALGLPAGSRVLLHFGHDPDAKGTDRVEALARELPGFTVIVVGAPHGWRSPRNGIRYVDPSPDPRQLYLAADALVAPSRLEGGDPPLAVAEALACGTPVIASAIPGHLVLRSIGPAVQLSDGSPSSLASDVLRSPANTDPSFVRARHWLSENFSLERYAQEIVEHYEEIAGAG
jgi:glycosyltransferase involved in cell wall biosynthesis